MAEWISTLGRALLLDTAAFNRLRARRYVFAEGLLVISIVALLVGLPDLVSNTVKALQIRPTSATETAEASAAFSNGLDQTRAVLDYFPPDMRAAAQVVFDQVSENFHIGLDIGTQIATLRSPLPEPIGQVLRQVGAWASRPFGQAGVPLAAASLGAWLGYGIWVTLLAKLLGGRGSLASFFGTTAVFAVPHLLLVLKWIPFVGSLLALIAFVWGLVLYVKATAISHEISIDKAMVAVAFIPIVLPGVLLWIASGVSALR